MSRMGKKYIIELEDNEFVYKTIISNGYPMIQIIVPAPYTELDLEQVNAEKDKIYDEARARGYEEGKARGYQEGLFDAWEAARKIASDNAGQNYSIFGQHFTAEILNTHSASEAIEKIRQYEQEQEEIIDPDKNKVEALANDIGIHKLFALVKEIRGE